jgi:hypothetical protein
MLRDPAKIVRGLRKPLGGTESIFELSLDRIMTPSNGIEEVLTSFYEIISGYKSEQRDWDKFRALFYPGAVLFPNSVTTNPTVSKGIEIDEYISSLNHFLSQNDFFEKGSITQIKIENNIASVISTYEAKRSASEQPFKRGVNFVQFICVEGKWKITSMIWQDL